MLGCLESKLCVNPIKKIKHKIIKVQRELRAWAHAKFEKWDTYLECFKWVVWQLDRMEEVRNLNTMEFQLRIKLREHVFSMVVEKEAK